MLPLRAFSALWGSSLRGGASFSCAHGPRLRGLPVFGWGVAEGACLP